MSQELKELYKNEKKKKNCTKIELFLNLFCILSIHPPTHLLAIHNLSIIMIYHYHP